LSGVAGLRARATAVVVAIGACVGCTTVLGISPGEYDPDPFGALAADGGDADAARPDDAALPGDAADAGDAAARADAALPACTSLLDDLEDGDGTIARCAGRNGSWYTQNDDTAGVQTPAPGRPFLPAPSGARGSRFAARTYGNNGFSKGGAEMGFDLSFVAGRKSTYDASKYSGVTFWAKAATALKIYVNFPDRNTDPLGGICTGTVCNDTFGKGITITTAWAEYTVLFKDLSTDATPPKFPAMDAAHLYSIEFHVAKLTAFDVWVDDVAFLP
jgi:hypothetical protein